MTGFGVLFRAAVRRDRVAIPIWVLSIGVLMAMTTSSVKSLYPTQADLHSVAETVAGNPAVVAIRGRDIGLDTYGGTLAWQSGWFAMVIAALMSLLLVVRHTRADEETGRAELLLSQPVGPFAQLGSALAVVALADIAMAAAVALPMAMLGIPVGGSVVLGASVGGFGLVFAGIAAVTAQLASTGRAASGLAGAALGAAYAIRAVGDVKHASAPWLSWLSPMGWGQGMRPFTGDRWWPLALSVGAAVALVLLGGWLRARRDFQAGAIQPTPGSARASAALASAGGLAVRLQRATFVAWASGLFIIGIAYGSLGNSVADMVDTSEQLKKLFIRGSADFVDAYFSTTSLVLALAAAGFAVQSVLRLRSEETSGRAEPLLATALSRARWAISHFAVSVVGGVALVAIAGLGTGIAYAFEGGGADQPWRLAWAGIVQAPAVWLLAALALALIGVVPRAAAAVWAVVAFCVVDGFLGPLLGLPDWVDRLSPYDHTPKLPAADFAAAPLLALTAIAAVLTAVGLIALRRRDIG